MPISRADRRCSTGKAIARALAETHPQHVHGRAQIVDTESGAFAHGRMAPAGVDHQRGADLDLALRRIGPHAGDAAALLDQAGRLGLHAQIEGGKGHAMRGQEIPLRHEGDEPAMRRKVAEVGDPEAGVAHLAGQTPHFGVRQLEEFAKQAEASGLVRKALDEMGLKSSQVVPAGMKP